MYHADYMRSAQSKMIDVAGIQAEIIRSRRKTAAINVRDCRVSVRVPWRFPEAAAREFIQLKKQWILRKLGEQQQLQAANTKAFVSGEALRFLGNHYRLQVRYTQQIHVELRKNTIIVGIPDRQLPAGKVKQALVDWYQSAAAEVLMPKVEQFSQQMGLQPTAVTLRKCKSRWGSCSPSGRIMFNWKIVMAPEAVVDYLVVHELSHILELNHSSRFWQHVESVLPDYAEQRKWLRDNGRYLEI